LVPQKNPEERYRNNNHDRVTNELGGSKPLRNRPPHENADFGTSGFVEKACYVGKRTVRLWLSGQGPVSEHP
jgi:hypothetical protein